MILHSRPTIDNDDVKQIVSLLEDGHLEEGDVVIELEKYFCNLFNTNYSSAVSNGFAAIHLSLMALDLNPKDEIIIPSYACSAILNPILLLNCKPLVVDIGNNSFNISVEEIKNKITKRTKAIIVPHVFGFPARIDEIISLGIPVIEDCAQSIGGDYKGTKLGSYGNLSIFSFYSSKMICSGDGGMIITNNDIYKEIIDNYRYYGHKKLHRYTAYNYHLTNLPATLALSQLKKIESFIQRRKEIATIYDEYFSNCNLIDIKFENKFESCYYRYPVRLKCNIELVKSKMFDENILCGYGVLDGIHQILNLKNEEYKNTTNNLKSILSLPIYPTLRNEEVYQIAETLMTILKTV